MATTREILEFIIKADGTAASASFRKVGDSADDVGKKVGKGGLSGALDKLGVSGAASSGLLAAGFIGAGAAIGGFAVKAIGDFQETALAAGKFAESTGLSAEESSRWIEVANDIGISTDQLTTSFGRLLKGIGANPEKFRELGITASDSKGQILQALEVLNRTPEGAERAALGAELFGRSWQSMSELIGMGADEITAALDSVESAKIIDDGEVEKARKFRDTLDQLQGAVESATIAFGQFAVEGITPVLAELGTLLSKLDGVTAAVGGLGGLLGKVLGNIPGIGSLEGVNVALDGSADNIDRLKGAATAILPPLKALPFGLFDVESGADKAAKKAEELAKAARDVSPGLDLAGRAAAGFVDQMSATELEVSRSAAAMADLKASNEAAGQSSVDAISQHDGLAQILGGPLAQSFADAEQAANDYLAAVLSLENANLAAETAVDRVGDSVDDATKAYAEAAEAAKKYGKGSTEAAAAAEKADDANRDLRGSVLSSSAAIAEAILQQQGLTGATATTAQKQQAQSQALIQLKAQYPAVAAEVDRLVASINRTPPSKTTNIHVTDNGTAGDVQYRINQITGRRVNVYVDYRDGGNYTSGGIGAARRGTVGMNAMGDENWRGGLTWVGERGRELVDLPGGSQIVPNNKIDGVFGGGGGDVHNITINMPPGSDGADVVRTLEDYKRRSGGSRLRSLVA